MYVTRATVRNIGSPHGPYQPGEANSAMLARSGWNVSPLSYGRSTELKAL